MNISSKTLVSNYGQRRVLLPDDRLAVVLKQSTSWWLFCLIRIFYFCYINLVFFRDRARRQRSISERIARVVLALALLPWRSAKRVEMENPDSKEYEFNSHISNVVVRLPSPPHPPVPYLTLLSSSSLSSQAYSSSWFRLDCSSGISRATPHVRFASRYSPVDYQLPCRSHRSILRTSWCLRKFLNALLYNPIWIF